VHGHFIRSSDDKFVHEELSYRWVNFEDIKGETGSTVETEEIGSKSDCIKNMKTLMTACHQDVSSGKE